MPICQSCIEAVLEDGGDAFGLTEEDAEEIAPMMGADITDHVCDANERGGALRCDCACRRLPRRR